MGVVFKMYASESKGEKFPTKRLYQGPNCDQVSYDIFFNGPSVYPEYLTDTNILICPSDPQGTAGAADWMTVDLVDACQITDISYTYWGWAIMPEHYLVLGGNDNAPYPATSDVDTNFLFALAEMMQPGGNPPYPPTDYDKDVSFTDSEGASQTIYRLREGIERFFITDINNPAGSAKAQSEVAVMHDQVSYSPVTADGYVDFNHTPGGGNVLFMDGHVEFLRYSSRYPVCTAWLTMKKTLDDAAAAFGP
jgi:prepilin-type processing-associated H-X9-DG protein